MSMANFCDHQYTRDYCEKSFFSGLHYVGIAECSRHQFEESHFSGLQYVSMGEGGRHQLEESHFSGLHYLSMVECAAGHQYIQEYFDMYSFLCLCNVCMAE